MVKGYSVACASKAVPGIGGHNLPSRANQLGGVLPDHRACHLDAGYDSGAARSCPVGVPITQICAHHGQHRHGQVAEPIKAGTCAARRNVGYAR
jgi:hypothetical protein